LSSIIPTHEDIGEFEPINEDGNCDHLLMVPNKARTKCIFISAIDIGINHFKTGGYHGKKNKIGEILKRVNIFGIPEYKKEHQDFFARLKNNTRW
jgi:hypothetical protein